MEIKVLQKALEELWCRETCYEPQQHKWSEQNPSLGQCFVTALVVNDFFGGEIYKVKSSNGVSHYFNAVDGVTIDLTSTQFPDSEVFSERQQIKRGNLEENDRYFLFKNKVLERIMNFE